VSRTVLDASAVLAILRKEPGYDTFLQKLDSLPPTALSSVNLAEVHSKRVKLGVASQDAWDAARSGAEEIFDFDSQQAKITADIVSQTQPLGLSLGDRACLALGIALDAEVYTADRTWQNLQLKVLIHIIR